MKNCPVCGSNSWQGFGSGWVSCEGSLPDGSVCRDGFNLKTGEEDFG